LYLIIIIIRRRRRRMRTNFGFEGKDRYIYIYPFCSWIDAPVAVKLRDPSTTRATPERFGDKLAS